MSANPYLLYVHLHAAARQTRVPEIQMRLVERCAFVHQISVDTETFTTVSSLSILRFILGGNMLTTDGAEQRLRKPFVHWLAAKSVRKQLSAEAQAATRHLKREALQYPLGAAVNDPAHVVNTDTFVVTRPNRTDHLALGAGKQFRIESALARLEAQIGLRL